MNSNDLNLPKTSSNCLSESIFFEVADELDSPTLLDRIFSGKLGSCIVASCAAIVIIASIQLATAGPDPVLALSELPGVVLMAMEPSQAEAASHK